MAQPITWRNVDAPSFGEASRMMALAQNGINSGFENFNNILKNEQATVEANWKVQRDNNTQAFLDSINQYRTPEEYQAALTSGALDPSKFGAQIDQAAVRSALDGRLAILQDRAVKANQFAEQQKALEAKPIVDQLSMMALSDDKDVRASAKAALAPYMEAGMLPNGAELAGKIRTIDHENDTWARDKTKFDQGTETFEQQKKLWPGQLVAQTDAHNLAVAQQEELRARHTNSLPGGKLEMAARKAQGEREYKAYQETGMFGKGYSDDPTTNVSNLRDSVVKPHFGSKDTKGTEAVMEVLRENPSYTYGSGQGATKVGYPPAVVQKALELTKEDSSIFGMGGGYNDNFKKAFKENLNKEMSSDDVWKQYTVYNNIRANYLEGTGPGPVAPTATGIPKPTEATQQGTQAAPSAVAALEKRAAEAAASPGVKDIVGKAGTPARDAAAAHALTSIFAGPRNVPVGTAAVPQTLAEMRDAAKKDLGVTNAPAEQPKVSAPFAGNLGQAKVPTVASSTVVYNADGSPTTVNASPPSREAVKSLSTKPEVVSRYEGAIPKGEGTKVRVTVGDGDTLTVAPTDPNKKIPNAVGNICRLDLIDAPETAKPWAGKPGQPGAEEAKAYLENLIANKEVTIKVYGQDKRKDDGPVRNICQVEIEGRALDLEMVRAGFAHVYDKYISSDNPRAADLRKAQDFAMTNNLGVFKDGYAEPPWLFKKRQDKLSK